MDEKTGDDLVLIIAADRQVLEEIQRITKDTYKAALTRCEISGRPLA